MHVCVPTFSGRCPECELCYELRLVGRGKQTDKRVVTSTYNSESGQRWARWLHSVTLQTQLPNAKSNGKRRSRSRSKGDSKFLGDHRIVMGVAANSGLRTDTSFTCLIYKAEVHSQSTAVQLIADVSLILRVKKMPSKRYNVLMPFEIITYDRISGFFLCIGKNPSVYFCSVV